MEATMEERFTPAQLKDWRKGYGWTQPQAADRIFLSLDDYRKKEQGQCSVSRKDMRIIRSVDQEEAKKKATA
jgi:hypothetical protein